MLQFKQSKIKIKEVSEAGTFEGILSPYGNIDGGGDIVERGAYAKTLADQGSTRPLLWSHNTACPIGTIELEDRPDGLWCKGALLLELQDGKDAYIRIKSGVVKGLSIGFESIQDSIENGIRHLKQIRLWEGSLVVFPMNSAAVVTAVKAFDAVGVDLKSRLESKDDFNEELAELQTWALFSQIIQALAEARYSLIWDDQTRDEKIASHAEILRQFVARDTEFFPQYLDAVQAMYGEMEMWGAKQPEIKARLLKSGATFSASNKKTIQSAADQAKAVYDTLSALISEEAGAATSDEKAATLDIKPEPAEDHSAALEEIRSLIPA